MSAAVTVGPLEAVAPRLSGLSDHLAYEVGVPGGTGWHRLADLADPELLAGWHRDLAAREGDRKAAAAYLAGWISGAAAEAWLLPVLAGGCLPLAGPPRVRVHRHADGWFDAVAVPAAPVAVLPGDPHAGQTGVVVASGRGALLDGVAERLSGLGAVFAALRAACPIGPVALWGAVADAVASRALWLARLSDGDRQAAWETAEAVTDRLAAAQPRLRARPRPFPVPWSGGEELFQVRGTCCLWYRTVATPDPDGDGYCNTCPLRTDTSRTGRLRAHLEEQAAS